MKFGWICNWGGFILALMEPRSDHPCCHIWFNGGGSSDDDDGNDDDDDADDDDEDHHNEHNEHNDDDDKGAAGNGQAGRNVPRESPPIITLVVNPPHLLRSNYIGDFLTIFIVVMVMAIMKTKYVTCGFNPPLDSLLVH